MFVASFTIKFNHPDILGQIPSLCEQAFITVLFEIWTLDPVNV